MQGVTDEPIPKAITNNLTLPTTHCVGAELSFQMLKGSVAAEAVTWIQMFSEQLGAEIIEMNVQVDHVHLLLTIAQRSPSLGLWERSKAERQSEFLISSVS
jgi:hypothetical protein